jgi:hypothetical protein
MASKAHQMITGLIVRRMRDKGYEIVCFDGDETIVTNVSLELPPAIYRHRPDAIGVNLKNGKICIGEAKTRADMDSKRTKEQISDFAKLIIDFKDQYELVIGIQKASEHKLTNLLGRLGLENNENISYVWIPEELLPNEEDQL